MMHDYDHIAFVRELDADQARELTRLIAEDDHAARLLSSWSSMLDRISEKVGPGAVDARTFALYVLRTSGREDALSPDERRRVQSVAPLFEAVLGRSGGLTAVYGDIHTDAATFESTWDEWFAPIERRTMDRPAVRLGESDRRRAGGGSARGRWMARAGVAAAIAAFAVMLTFVVQRDFGGVVVETGPGEVQTVDIGSGSTVRMLANSRLRFVPLGQASSVARQAEFDGAGFFEIAPDERGFVVRTPDAQAVVLGTSFGMRTHGEGTDVVLAEGSLALSSRELPERAVVLTPGQSSRVGTRGVPSQPVNVSVHEELAWTGLFVFHGAPLQEIAAELSSSFETDVFVDAALADERVTGRFEREQDLREILDVVAAAVGGRVIAAGTGYEVEP